MKTYFIYLLIILLYLASSCISKTESLPVKEKVVCDFELEVEYVPDYSLRLVTGTIYYRLNEKEINVIRHSNIFSIKDDTLFSKHYINDSLLTFFCFLQLDTLQELYNRNGVFEFSGISTELIYKKGAYEKIVRVHNDSHPATDEIILTINRIVPVAYQIRIPKAEEYKIDSL
jgi:hypothetical protein